MSEDAQLDTGRFLPVTDGPKTQLLLDALKELRPHNAFKVVVARFRERLVEVDASNRKRGQENQFTEAQALSWFLAAIDLAESHGERKVIHSPD